MLKGSSKKHLQEMALKIYQVSKKNGTRLSVVWKSRADPRLVLADDFSRALDLDDWGVDEETFVELSVRAGPFDCDLFASDSNHRCKKFFSRIASNKAMGRDAFLHDWGKLGKVFACPPPKLLSSVLRQFAACEAIGGLIVPRWYTLYAWPLICEDGRHLNRIFVNGKSVQPFLRKGEHVKSKVFSGFTPFPFLSLKVDGRVPHPFRSKILPQFCLEGGCSFCVE